ncbi:MAG: hypothetical protein KatS3mg025_0130 [Bacteroidia bacterium]|nr:MAG: hypothetical protein KatS3mg025_0130 [Bacteroidia bacterium]
MKSLIAFLGTGPYEEICYRYPLPSGESKPIGPSKFGFLAIAEGWKADRIDLFTTKEASERHRAEVETQADRLTPKPEIRFLEVEEAGHPTKLWGVFEKIGEALGEGQEVAVDITHGFRSFPLVGLAALAYFKHLRGLHVAHIWYAAFIKPREEQDRQQECPLIDLGIYLEVMELIWAVRQWRERGELSPVANLFRQAQKQYYTESKKDPRLGTLGRALEQLSGALRLVQPQLVTKYGRAVSDAFREAEAKDLYKELPSIKSLWDNLAKDIQELSRPAEAWEDALAQQLSLIEDYVEWKAYLPAVLLAREWLVTAWMGAGAKWQKKEARQEAEKQLGELLQKKQQKKANLLSYLLFLLFLLPQRKRQKKANLSKREELFSEAWGAIHAIRNRLAHCGMGEQNQSIPVKEEQMKEIVEKLRKVYQELI